MRQLRPSQFLLQKAKEISNYQQYFLKVVELDKVDFSKFKYNYLTYNNSPYDIQSFIENYLNSYFFTVSKPEVTETTNGVYSVTFEACCSTIYINYGPYVTPSIEEPIYEWILPDNTTVQSATLTLQSSQIYDFVLNGYDKIYVVAYKPDRSVRSLPTEVDIKHLIEVLINIAPYPADTCVYQLPSGVKEIYTSNVSRSNILQPEGPYTTYTNFGSNPGEFTEEYLPGEGQYASLTITYIMDDNSTQVFDVSGFWKPEFITLLETHTQDNPYQNPVCLTCKYMPDNYETYACDPNLGFLEYYFEPENGITHVIDFDDNCDPQHLYYTRSYGSADSYSKVVSTLKRDTDTYMVYPYSDYVIGYRIGVSLLKFPIGQPIYSLWQDATSYTLGYVLYSYTSSRFSTSATALDINAHTGSADIRFMVDNKGISYKGTLTAVHDDNTGNDIIMVHQFSPVSTGDETFPLGVSCDMKYHIVASKSSNGLFINVFEWNGNTDITQSTMTPVHSFKINTTTIERMYFCTFPSYNGNRYNQGIIIEESSGNKYYGFISIDLSNFTLDWGYVVDHYGNKIAQQNAEQLVIDYNFGVKLAGKYLVTSYWYSPGRAYMYITDVESKTLKWYFYHTYRGPMKSAVRFMEFKDDVAHIEFVNDSNYSKYVTIDLAGNLTIQIDNGFGSPPIDVSVPCIIGTTSDVSFSETYCGVRYNPEFSFTRSFVDLDYVYCGVGA